MQTRWRGPTRGNGMPGDQRSQHLIDPTFGCRVIPSCESHENFIQGHLVTLGPGLKNQMEQQDCMLLAPISVYCQCRYGNTTKTRTVEGFVELTHQSESCIERN